MSEKQIGVSVCCLVYNHEKYLRQCLDGFVMQKTTFPFEVIVHDDASTDHSADIIREYAEKYPDIIRPIYQTVNQYSQRVPITATFLMPMVRGKYVANCEGDDYWCDENKLQLQYEIMEENPDCHFCVHKVQGITEAGEEFKNTFPNYNICEGKMSVDEFLSHVTKGYAFQTSSYFRRTEDLRAYLKHKPDFAKAADVGDEPALLYYGSLGESYYLDRIMSCYRMQANGSWSASMAKNIDLYIKHCGSMIRMYELFNSYSGNKYAALVNQAIKRMELSKKTIALNEKERARLYLKKENRWYFFQLPVKPKIFVVLDAYVPWVSNAYRKLKRRTNER